MGAEEHAQQLAAMKLLQESLESRLEISEEGSTLLERRGCTFADELSACELSKRALSEKLTRDLELSENRSEEALAELETVQDSAAKASRAHRDAAHASGE